MKASTARRRGGWSAGKMTCHQSNWSSFVEERRGFCSPQKKGGRGLRCRQDDMPSKQFLQSRLDEKPSRCQARRPATEHS